MSFIDDLSHTVDRACDNAVAALRKKLGADKVDGSDADPSAPQDTVGAPLSEEAVADGVDQVMAEVDAELREAIRARIGDKWLKN
jgi:hypothetical protein